MVFSKNPCTNTKQGSCIDCRKFKKKYEKSMLSNPKYRITNKIVAAMNFITLINLTKDH